jgi:hypothetical protein
MMAAPRLLAGLDPGAGDRDSREVHEEHSEPDGQRQEQRDVFASVAENTTYTSTNVPTISTPNPSPWVYPLATALAPPPAASYAFTTPAPAHGAQALHRGVVERAREGELAGQEQPEGHGRVDVPARHARGAVHQHEDRAAERPRDALHANVLVLLHLCFQPSELRARSIVKCELLV